jgi:WD40 repeat protein
MNRIRPSLLAVIVTIGIAPYSMGQKNAEPAKPLKIKHIGGRICVAFSPDGKTLATGGQDNHVRFWDATTGLERRAIETHRAAAGVSRIAFFPDGKTLASASWAGDGTVKLWDVARGKERQLLGQDRGGIPVLAVALSGKRLAWGNAATIHVHDVEANRELHVLYGSAAIDSAAFSPDDKVLATSNGDTTVRLWNVATGQPIRDLTTFPCTATGSHSVAFAPDGRSIVIASRNVRIWDLVTDQEGPALPTTESVFYVAFSPDGRWLAAATFRAIHLWATETQNHVHSWPGRVTSIAFAPDGNRIAFGYDGGAAVIAIGELKK